MNLWVRSQDKENLIPIKNPICVYDNKIIYKESASYVITIGEFETKERALEVLDEIQDLLQLKIEYKPIVQEEYNVLYPYKNFIKVDDNMEIKEFSTFVYQIPEN
jgi:hypothetical protein